jgi:hypothetical protein
LSSVRITSDDLGDGRIELLGGLAGYNRYEALGRLTHLRATCIARGSAIVSEASVRGFLGPEGVEALVGAELGEVVEGGVLVYETEAPIERARKLRANAAAGGRAKASNRLATAKQMLEVCKESASPELTVCQDLASETPAHARPESEISDPDLRSGSQSSLSRAHDPPAIRRRRELGDDLWLQHQSLRARLHVELGCAGPCRPLQPMDTGRAMLAERITELGAKELSAAREACEYVLSMAEQEAKARGTTQYLDGQLWRRDRFERLSHAVPEHFARAGPRRSGDIRTGAVAPGSATKFRKGEVEL